MDDSQPTGHCRFCERPVRHRTLSLCFRCYSYLRTWRDRPIGAKRERKAQLESLNNRMEYMIVAAGPMPAKQPRKVKAQRKSNVVTLRQRKRKPT